MPPRKSVAVPGKWSVIPLPSKRGGTRSHTTQVQRDTAESPVPEDEYEDGDDAVFAERHQEFEGLEHRGFDVVAVTLRRRDDLATFHTPRASLQLSSKVCT